MCIAGFEFSPSQKKSNFLCDLIFSILFVGSSAAAWWLSNGGIVAREEGFDPLRYEYLARSDFPEYLAESSSYNIVRLLRFLYIITPQYVGFVVIIALFLFSVLRLDREKILRAATFSPIAFFYFGQTGKDGLAILSMVVVASQAVYGLREKLIYVFFIPVLALYVRPALVFFFPVVFVLFRMGLRWTIILTAIFSFVVLLTLDFDSRNFILQDVVRDESSGLLARLSRELTFGSALVPVMSRSVLLFFSPFFQPITSLFKMLSNGNWFVVFEGGCQLFFLAFLIRRKILVNFLIASIPFVLLVSILSPFYHFRYLAVCYPVILAYAQFISTKFFLKINSES